MSQIMLLHAFKGFSPGVQDFGDTENARLVSLGLATEYSSATLGPFRSGDLVDVAPITAAEVAAGAGVEGQSYRISDGPDAGIEVIFTSTANRPTTSFRLASAANQQYVPGAARAYKPARPDTPIFMIGGDHPHLQWYGTNGYNGLAQVYLERGITPYVSINTHSTAAQNPGDDNCMTWAQMREMQARGVEFTSHGARHITSWEKLNTGIACTYGGAAATATIYVTSTDLVGVTAGAVADFTISLTGKTLDQIAAEVEAVSDWTCVLAPELAGTESALLLVELPVAGAKDAKATGGAKLATCAGLTIQYTGALFHKTRITVDANASLRLYGDGVVQGSFSLSSASYDTLTEVVNAINALTDWVAYLADNDNSISATSDNYVSGAEKSTAMHTIDEMDCKSRPIRLTVGMTREYAQHRQFVKAQETMVANGIDAANFQQPGGDLFEDMVAGDTLYTTCRGNARFGYPPLAVPAAQFTGFYTHYSYSSDSAFDSTGRVTAIARATEGSGAVIICVLIHSVEPDGSSGYTLIPTAYGIDQTETRLIALLDEVQTLALAGEIRPCVPRELQGLATNSAKRKNLLYNPKLINSGETLTGLTAVQDGNVIPGYRIKTPANLTTFEVADGVLTVTNNDTADYAFLQTVRLAGGETYELSCTAEAVGTVTGTGTYWTVTPVDGPAYNAIPGQTFSGGPYLRKSGRVVYTFTVPPAFPEPAEIICATGPYDLSTVNKIRVNIDSLGLTSDINCAGTTPAATTASEVAAAINAAITANASYPVEYRTAASVINGRVVVRSPYAQGGVNTRYVLIDNGTATDALSVITGGTTSADPVGSRQPSPTARWYLIGLYPRVTGTVKLSQFCLTKKERG